MKLAYKLLGLVLASGASVAAYLLIPAAPVETIESGPKPLPETEKSSASWKTSLINQGYVPVNLGTPFEDHPRLLETFKKVKNLVDGTEGAELRKLCNSFENKNSLSVEEEAEAKRWCVNPRGVGDILKSKGRKYIYKMENEMEVWDMGKTRELARKYMQNPEVNLKMETSWDNSNPLVISENDLSGNLESFKTACTKALTTWSFEENLDQKTKQAEQWCTEE